MIAALLALAAPPSALPAYQHPLEVPSARARVSDLRAAFPERYAVTVPPAMPALRPHTAWDPVDAVILSVPGTLYAPPEVRVALADIALAVSTEARLIVCHDAAASRQAFTSALSARGVPDDAVTWVDVALDSVWQADYGPWSVLDDGTGTQAFADFRYYDPRPNDDSLPTVLGALLGGTTYRMAARYEGGNVITDAQHRCYSTQRGLSLSGLAEEALATSLREYLGCTEVVWLWDIPDDRTGHVDMAVMLPAPGLAVVGRYAAGHPSAQRLDDNAAALAASGLDVRRLPMPGHVEVDSGFTKENVPFTYVNASRVDQLLVWPRYDQPGWEAVESEAAEVWAEALPELDRIPVTVDALALLSGAVHCVMRTVNDAPVARWVPDGACSGGRCAAVSGFEALSYDGPCVKGVCAGPRWECACNDCSAPCPVTAPCELDLTVAGCCDGDRVRWCDGGIEQGLECTPGTCGWDPLAGWYACGTAGEEAPEAPKSCHAAGAGDDGAVVEPQGGDAEASAVEATAPASSAGCGQSRPREGRGGLAFVALACHLLSRASRYRRRSSFFTCFRIGRPPASGR